jgi:hypothetical protein
MRRPWLIAILLSVAVAIAALAGDKPRRDASSSKAASSAPKGPPKKPSHLRIDSGELLSATGMPIHVSQFDALVGGDQKQNPKDGKKAVVTILDGTALLTDDAITRLLTSHLGSDSKIRDLQVSTEAGRVTIKGKTHKGIDLGFQIEGTVSATPEGLVKLQISDESLAHLPKGLSQDLGMDVRKMVPSNAGKGIKAEKNSLSFDPDLLWGLPIHGHVTKATLEKRGLVLLFANDQAAAPAKSR